MYTKNSFRSRNIWHKLLLQSHFDKRFRGSNVNNADIHHFSLCSLARVNTISREKWNTLYCVYTHTFTKQLFPLTPVSVLALKLQLYGGGRNYYAPSSTHTTTLTIEMHVWRGVRERPSSSAGQRVCY